MTDLKLQEVLVGEIRSLLQNQSLKKLDGTAWKDLNVYQQEKPYKDDEDDAAQEDYIIVMLGDEDLGEDRRWKVDVHMIMSICLYENAHQGNMILANLMNQIFMHLQRKGIIGDIFGMEPEAYKRFNHECYPNYYECDLITVWKLPEVERESSEDFI